MDSVVMGLGGLKALAVYQNEQEKLPTGVGKEPGPLKQQSGPSCVTLGTTLNMAGPQFSNR